MTEIRDEKRFWGLWEVLLLSWPAAMSMLSSTVTRFVDGLMVARLGGDLGPISLAAQTSAGIIAFAPESFAMGALTVVNTYVSQNMGAGRLKRCGEYAWAGMGLALICSLLIMPLSLVSGPLFHWMGHDPAVVGLENMYFRYMVLAVVLTLPARVLEGFFFGIQRPGVVFVTSAIANTVNILANWVLIYGKWGFPTMGLEGAAIASVSSWGLQLAMLSAVFLTHRMRTIYGTAVPKAASWIDVREIISIGWPAGLQFGNDVLSWGVFVNALIGQFGTAHLAASSAAMRYMPLSFMPAVGIGIAATALVGKYIGQGRTDLARRRTHVALLTAMVYMGACGLAFYLLRYPMVEAFAVSQEGRTLVQGEMTRRMIDIGANVMILAAVFQLFDAVGIVFIGALRGAGDTFWPMVMTIILSWGATVGGGLAFIHFAPQLESVGPWIAASLYVVLLGLLVAWRFEGGAWKKIDLLKRRPLAAPAVDFEAKA